MSSQKSIGKSTAKSTRKSTDTRRVPQRQRGHERVAALLEAAAGCFVDKGFDATTMTEIAAQAGASIGSLYQFFPTKEILARALLDQYAQALYAQLATLSAQSIEWTIDDLAARLSTFLVSFRRRHPAFVVLTESASIPAAEGMAIRRRVRGDLQALLALRAPNMPAAALRAVAVAVQQLMKAPIAVQAEPGLVGRPAVLDELRRAMQLYLRAVLVN
jgi:AcrR family transcriptional regulator